MSSVEGFFYSNHTFASTVLLAASVDVAVLLGDDFRVLVLVAVSGFASVDALVLGLLNAVVRAVVGADLTREMVDDTVDGFNGTLAVVVVVGFDTVLQSNN